jgi:hypothetical protein
VEMEVINVFSLRLEYVVVVHDHLFVSRLWILIDECFNYLLLF